MNNPILLQDVTNRLAEAIQTSDQQGIRNSITAIINQRLSVRVSQIRVLSQCCVHQYYFPGQLNKFESHALNTPAYCTLSHQSCGNCLRTYVSSLFPRSSCKIPMNVPDAINTTSLIPCFSQIMIWKTLYPISSVAMRLTRHDYPTTNRIKPLFLIQSLR